jgi:hypothetical protein
MVGDIITYTLAENISINKKPTPMNQSITTLALNLLISERLNHRIVFAGKIIETLQQSVQGLENEEEKLNNFVAVISKCTQEPNCEERELFFELAQYYNSMIFGQSNLSAVA